MRPGDNLVQRFQIDQVASMDADEGLGRQLTFKGRDGLANHVALGASVKDNVFFLRFDPFDFGCFDEEHASIGFYEQPLRTA